MPIYKFLVNSSFNKPDFQFLYHMNNIVYTVIYAVLPIVKT